MQRSVRIVAVALVLTACGSLRLGMLRPDILCEDAPPEKAQAAEATPAEAPQPKPPTHVVEAKPFRITVALDGIFMARRTSEISLSPEAWTEFTVETAVEHGTKVGAGDVILAFDPKRIDEAIADLETGNRLAEIALRQARAELDVVEASFPMDVAAAERSATLAADNLRRFQQVGLARSEKGAHFSLKSSRSYLEYAEEELKQLEKMYEADDLTEETEEIVLKRQRDAVERAKFSVEGAEIDHEESLARDIPLRDVAVKEAARRQELALEKSRIAMPLALEKQRIEYANLEKGLAKSKERLRNLRKDRALMTVKAPFEGIVYYGRCVQGSWSDVSTAAGKLRKGGSVPPKDAVMTVVAPRPLRVAATAPEAELHNLRRGIRGHAMPTGYPDLRLPVSIDKLLTVPVGRGSFAVELKVDAKDDAEAVLPGMTCKMQFTAYDKKKALVVPRNVIFEDEDEPGRYHVYVPVEGAEPEKREVRIGKRTGDQVEIVEGVKAGEAILLEKPKGAS